MRSHVADGPGTNDGERLCLFSGGKDSTWALHRVIKAGPGVDRLLTVHPPGDSYLYHVPATELANLAAESIGLPLEEVDARELDAGDRHDSSADRATAEVAPLEAALKRLRRAGRRPGALVVGAVESRYQFDRVSALCDRNDLALHAPLWGRDPERLLRGMLDAGFEITIVRVAADGLDASWLGRTLDGTALEELRDLHERHGVHLLGEGGEYETLVTDGPHMSRPIRIDAEPEWEGTHGRLRIHAAHLG